MDSKFLAALKKKFRTPQEAMAARGLDADLLDPDEPSPVIAHDSAWATTKRGSTRPVNRAEYKLLNAMRNRYRTMDKPMKLLGLDQADLDDASGEPDDGNGDVAQIMAMFKNLSDSDKAVVVSEIAAMGDENGETAGDRERRRFAQDHGLPYHHRAGSPSAFAQRLTRRIGNGFG